MSSADSGSERNLDLRDELLALREGTAQSYGHAEALKAQWQEIEKAQSSLYQVSATTWQRCVACRWLSSVSPLR